MILLDYSGDYSVLIFTNRELEKTTNFHYGEHKDEGKEKVSL